MAEYLIQEKSLTNIADKIREKTGTEDLITLAQMASMILSISGGETVGLDARIFNVTIQQDATSGAPTILEANEWLASIRDDPNAFVMMRCLNPNASTAMLSFWLTSNSVICYKGETEQKAVLLRTSTSDTHVVLVPNPLNYESSVYSGFLNLQADGRLYIFPAEAYPLRAGEYQVIAGKFEEL